MKTRRCYYVELGYYTHITGGKRAAIEDHSRRFAIRGSCIGATSEVEALELILADTKINPVCARVFESNA